MNKRKKGYKGEDMAEEFLLKKGFKILQRNYQAGHSEIDLVVQDGDWLVFVEVKLRENNDHGYPEESLSKSKKNFIMRGADAYVQDMDYEGKLRFDVISITLKPFEIIHFEDAFY